MVVSRLGWGGFYRRRGRSGANAPLLAINGGAVAEQSLVVDVGGAGNTEGASNEATVPERTLQQRR